MFTLNSSRIRVYNIMVVPQGTDTSVYVPWEVLAPTPTNFQQLIPSECGLTSKNAGGSKTSTIADFESGIPTTIQLREVPEIGVRDTAKYLGSGKWEVTRNVAEVNLTDLSWSTVFDQLYATVPNAAPSDNNNVYTCKSNAFYGMTRNQISYADASGTQNGVCLAGKNLRLVYPEKPTPTEFKTWLQEMATAGTPVIVWYQLKTPITEYLQIGELKTYPGYTALEVSGDFLPEVTAGAKVADTV